MTAFTVIAGVVILAAAVFVIRRRLKADSVVAPEVPTSGSPSGTKPGTADVQHEVR